MLRLEEDYPRLGIAYGGALFSLSFITIRALSIVNYLANKDVGVRTRKARGFF